MSNFNSDGSQDHDGDDRGELAWNEFDWERYLREQDGTVSRYLTFYEAAQGDRNRIDTVAEKMGWGHDDWSVLANHQVLVVDRKSLNTEILPLPLRLGA